MTEGSRRGRKRVGLFGLALATSGCCITPAPAEKFFDRTSPVEALRGFVYAVDVQQWEYAHESLSAESREEISVFRLEWAVRLAEINFYDAASGEEKALEVSLYELISNSLERVKRHEPRYRAERDGTMSMLVRTKARDDDMPIAFDVRIYFVREDDDWRVDLLKSLRLAR